MIVPAYARWSAYALAAVLTLAAMAGLGEGGGGDAVVQPSARGAAARPIGPVAVPSADAGALRLAQPAARNAQAALADPFAVLGAAAEDGAAAAQMAAAARATASGPRTPSAPPLPFVYLGSWKENGRTSVFVQRDDRAYKIDGPGPLDAEYAVRSVDEDRISLNYLPLGIVQELRLDAPAATSAVAAAPPAQPSSPEPDTGEN